jgi:hypothetical protein
MTDDRILVTMRASQADLVARDSTADTRCGDCHELVVMAPSSRRLLAADPQTRILCLNGLERLFSGGALTIGEMGMAAEPEELVAEVASAVPNTWKERN